MRLFFVINQDPRDGSAHALYCMRHVLALAAARPRHAVELVCAARCTAAALGAAVDRDVPSNFSVTGLPHVRRPKRGLGFTLSAVFHHAAWRHLRRHAREGDIAATASFPKLLEFLGRRVPRLGARRPRLVYEVHQLEQLGRPSGHPKVEQEQRALRLADRLVTTTQPLWNILQSEAAGISCANLGLAVGHPPAPDRLRREGEPFRLGYFGSTSPEQGVPWLAGAWPRLRPALGPAAELHIYGRVRRGETAVAAQPGEGLFVHEPVAARGVPEACRPLDALIIPALAQAHRPAIAFTKAYDYLGLARPIVAADLPTVREVLRLEKDALLFTPGDEEALRTQLARLASDAALRMRLRASCLERAEHFSWERRAEAWWDFATA